MYFVYGAAGAVVALLLFLSGGFAGWKLRGLSAPETAVKPPTETQSEEERRRILDEQKAFGTMMGYDTSMVYGTRSSIEELIGKKNGY